MGYPPPGEGVEGYAQLLPPKPTEVDHEGGSLRHLKVKYLVYLPIVLIPILTRRVAKTRPLKI